DHMPPPGKRRAPSLHGLIAHRRIHAHYGGGTGQACPERAQARPKGGQLLIHKCDPLIQLQSLLSSLRLDVLYKPHLAIGEWGNSGVVVAVAAVIPHEQACPAEPWALGTGHLPEYVNTTRPGGP